MAKKNLWHRIFCNCEVVENNLSKETKVSDQVLKAQMVELEKQVAALVGGLYRIERYSIGPKSPDIGIFEKEVFLSDIPLSLRGELLSCKQVISASGLSPVSWSGYRWILINK